MTRADRVIDASVLGSYFFSEDRSEEAEIILAEGGLVAPDHLLAEVANLAAKKVWRGLTDHPTADRAVRVTPTLVHEFAPIAPLTSAALSYAVRFQFSAYDALYLALADDRSTTLLTFDEKLIRRAEAEGLGHLIARF